MVGPPGQGAAAPMGSQQGQCAQQPKGQNHISAGGLPVELLLRPADVQRLAGGEEQHQWGLC